MERTIEWRPAWDKRSSDPNKNYGIHGVEMVWLVNGPEGIIQWVVFTGWNLKHVQEELDRRHQRIPHLTCHPQPADLGYHSPKPMYEGQTKMDQCAYLPEGCYYDGSSLNAHPLYWLLVEKGAEAVWAELEDYYKERFLTHPPDA